MDRIKVAILGGGISGLATAFELTRTPSLRARYDVHVYQRGWRLGGKLASGRRGPGGRNEEHGLHVWFGFYENAFAMLRETYGAWTPPPGCPLARWDQAFRPRSFTPVPFWRGDALVCFPLLWPRNDDRPGEGGVEVTPWGAFTEVVSLLGDLLGCPFHEDDDPREPSAPVPHGIVERFREAIAGWSHADAPIRLEGCDAYGLRTLLRLAHHWARAHAGDDLSYLARHSAAITWVLRECLRLVREAAEVYLERAGGGHFLLETADVLVAVLCGLLDPRWGILEHDDAGRIDHLEFREWLLACGANADAVQRGSFVRALYDAAFQYVDGDLARPSMEAGTCLRGLLRMIGTYKGAVFWEVSAGMGECVITPLYRVLEARGVTFHFFHQIARLELSENGNVLRRIQCDVQAAVAEPPYRPLLPPADGLECWPVEPDWEQLVDGDGMRAAGADFESHWCQWPPAARTTLEAGRDFDVAVLALALGAYKPLNHEPTLADELLARKPAFRDMVAHLGIVPTLAMQVWLTRDLAQLGFDPGRKRTTARPAIIPGPEPFDTYADMSQVLAFERWPAAGGPRSLHYWCGPFATTLHTRPSTDAAVPATAALEVKRLATAWLERWPGYVWPKATAAPGRLGIDWAVVHDPEGRAGSARFDAQFWRANVDPSECTVASFAGTARWRLAAEDTGVMNLLLAGECARTGLDVTCVEACVMSGMAAARAISGVPRRIVGERFLARSSGGL